ncbi:MAG: hypothetical protein A2128_00040 [Candidatus Liptonbacteria bacterium GWC1_60_9]|uniref:Tetratricopeptide repeat-like domain-containing protein n=1 Tax=Candidatus Liptonbacteria bacterium GWC1_60_9 TaxID=1798645 RepID=A0A1G2C6C8_9BACT|nr:MAG: hypothetical protein A2128_00040 [Candidatus Liptonbacteria bacterium GWC1_60_9]
MAKQRRIAILLALAVVLLGVGMGMEGMRLWEARTLNRAAQSGEIAAAEGDLPLEALFSRAYWLKRYGRFDSAAQKYNELRDRGDGGFRSGLHYNLGNVYLGQGVATRKGSFILLAEESYRDALAADPGAKDAKYNLARIIKIKREAAKKEGKKKEKKEESPQGWRFAPGRRGDNP